MKTIRYNEPKHQGFVFFPGQPVKVNGKRTNQRIVGPLSDEAAAKLVQELTDKGCACIFIEEHTHETRI